MEQNASEELVKDGRDPLETAVAVKDKMDWDDIKSELGQSRAPLPQKTEVTNVHFDELKKKKPDTKSSFDLDFILDIPLTLTCELGRSKMLISELLQLGQGSVLELTKLAGEPMDVYVNQRLIARGEVVVVNEKFGVRLTDIVSPAERVNKLV